MSLQIFLHGKILGIEEFLRSATDDLAARAQWVTLLSEVLPRKLLSEFHLSPMLLGSSGGGQFLLVLPQEVRKDAEQFCERAAADISERTAGCVSLVWSITENLGNWPDIRKRLLTDLYSRISAPGFTEAVTGGPVHVEAENVPDDVPFARHTAPDDNDGGPASPDVLASRADGRWLWGILRGDVDDFGLRLRRSLTIEEHLQLSMMYKQFFIGELQAQCSMPEYWRKVTLLYADGQDFAVLGAWDALIGLAREVQRLFAIFADATLKEYAGPEGKTISMAIALATEAEATPASVFADAGEKLESARTAGRDSIWVLGRPLDWKQLADAAESKTTMTRLIRECGVPRQLLDELAGLYREGSDTILTPGSRRANVRIDKPWRFYRRLNSTFGTQQRGRDFQRLKTDLIADFTGKRASNVRLRPQGRVALEWARLETDAI